MHKLNTLNGMNRIPLEMFWPFPCAWELNAYLVWHGIFERKKLQFCFSPPNQIDFYLFTLEALQRYRINWTMPDNRISKSFVETNQFNIDSISIQTWSKTIATAKKILHGWSLAERKPIENVIPVLHNEKYRHSFHACGHNNHFLVDAIIIIFIFSKLKLNLFLFFFCYCLAFFVVVHSCCFLQYKHGQTLHSHMQPKCSGKSTHERKTEWVTYTHTTQMSFKNAVTIVDSLLFYYVKKINFEYTLLRLKNRCKKAKS